MKPQFITSDGQLLVKKLTDSERTKMYPDIKSLTDDIMLARIVQSNDGADEFKDGDVVMVDFKDAIKLEIDGSEVYHIHWMGILGKVVEDDEDF